MRVKTLLIVYKEKDEAYFKQLKNLIDAKDDSDKTVGVEDGTVRTYKCPESLWLEHKAKGREKSLADKIIFIDDIKDIKLSSPVYNKYGISYGPIDKQQFAVVVDEKYAWDDDTYFNFRTELEHLTDDGTISEDAMANQKKNQKNRKRNGMVAALGVLFPVAFIVAGGMVTKNLADAKKNADTLRNQMLYFAITKVYLEELDKFMKA